MNKSQLRKLALRRAQGGLKLEEYQRRRRELIDEIVGGNLAIEREIPPPRPIPAPMPVSDGESTHAHLGQHPDEGSHSTALHYYFAAGAGVCIVVLIWALWPSAEKSTTAPVSPPPPVQQISVARTLVESFLALRDYSETAVSEFEHGWQKLDSREREQARSELWFRSLSRSIRDEVKTQRALAQLAATEDSIDRVDRLYHLAQILAITHQLPTRAQTPPAAGVRDTATTEPATPDQQILPALEIHNSETTVQAREPVEPKDQASMDSGTATTTTTNTDTATAREWLAMQPDHAFSLQIFAVNKLARVEQLMTRHPDHAFQILATEGAVPRFRVYLGSYSDKDQAAQAFAGLADDVKKAAGKALVKSFAEIRRQLESSPLKNNQAQPAAGKASPQYTLQLFASDNRNNALALTRQFSTLGLEVHELSNSAAAYRVVYGRFANTESALQARDRLPAKLLERIGTPLVKSLTELGMER